MDRSDQAWAVFRCSLLKPLLLDEIPAAEWGAYFQQLSQQEQLLPNGQRKKISVRTLRRWWQRLRDDGVEKLVRQRRANRGEPQQRHRGILARAVELKREQPRRSDQVINQILRQEFGRTVPRSTLYRHLRRNGATRLKLGVTEQKVRCRWTRDHSNALWVGDFSHGPVVLHEGHAVKTHLSAWIDCHSRYIVEARYYLNEDLDILVESLLHAWSNHGASREIYVDNAKIYHSGGLELACVRLGINLLHRPPRDPAPGGLIERFFQTLQGQFGAEVDASSLLTLVELNRLLKAWLSVAYHATIHSETRETPAARFAAGQQFLRQVDLHAVRHFFCRYVPRTVDRTHADISIDGRTFKVDSNLRGDSVIVRYDPFQPYKELLEVELLSDLGVYLGKGERYERERGAHPDPAPRQKPNQPADSSYLRALAAEHATEHQRQRQLGLDYRTARQRNVWSVTSWATKVAQLLGRAGLSSLTAAELEALQAFHAAHHQVHESLLRAAFAQAEPKSIPCILFQLQVLLKERK